MKTTYIILLMFALATIAFVTLQAFSVKSTSEVEMHQYEVLKKYDAFEIRRYEAANFSTVTMPSKSYKKSSSNGFRSLAGYIFGGNEANQAIAMTSPVVMDLQDSVTMKFMIPSEYEIDDLPKPNNGNVKFVSESEKTVAAVQFGGWADDKRINKYIDILSAELESAGIEHSEDFAYLGYNPPYEVVNRRNEVVVEIVGEFSTN